MTFDVGAATFDSAEPHSRHRIATTTGASHAYLFDLWDSPPAWYDVPATDLQPQIAATLVDAAESGVADIEAMVARCQTALLKLVEKKKTLYAGSGSDGAFATFPAPDRVEIGWIGLARVYRISSDGGPPRVELLSRDHSLINDYLIAQPHLTQEQINELPRDIVTRLIGAVVQPGEPGDGMTKPDVATCQLEIGEWLVIVPRGIDERVLGDPRLRKARTADAAAKLITALAIAAEPNRCAGAIVIWRVDDAAHSSDPEAAKSTRQHVRDLIASCPDAATESVLADWCEEHGRSELVAWLRHVSEDVRLCAARHLGATLEKSAVLTAESFVSGSRLAHALGKARWHRLASAVRTLNRESKHAPLTHLAQSIDLDDEDLTEVKWALAKELVDHVPAHFAERVRPFAELVTTTCPACEKPAFLVAESEGEPMDDGHLEWKTKAYALCVHELHCMLIGLSDGDGLPTART